MTPPAEGGARGRARGLLIVLLCATLAAYAGLHGHGFLTYDDDVYVTANGPVLAGLTGEGLRWALTASHGSNWHPLTWLSHMLDVELFALAPAGHHLVNLGLHLVNATLLWWFLRRTGRPAAVVFFVTALFALHPLRVESVAWVAERKDVLSGTCFFASLLSWAAYARRPGPGKYAMAALWVTLGMMSKPMLVTLPCVLLLLDRWPLLREGSSRGRSGRGDGPGRDAPPTTTPTHPGPTYGGGLGFRLWLEKAPLFALAGALVLVTLAVQSAGGATSSLDALSLSLRGLNALASLGIYVRQSFWPLGLAAFYPHAAIVSPAPVIALLPAAGLGVLVLAALGWACARRRSLPFAFVGLAWFVGMLVPVLGLVQVGTQAHADRYLYLPLVGLQWALVEGLVRLGRARPALGRPLLAFGATALVVLALLTRAQVAHWESSETLFRHALTVTRSNYVAHEVLGELRLEDGDPEGAERAFREALAVNPNYGEAHHNLGLVLLGRGDLAGAGASLERALALDPDDPLTHLGLGVVALEAGDLVRAERHFMAALERAPGLADAHFDLGLLEQRRGDAVAAEAHYREALRLDPEHVDAWSNLGGVLLGDERPALALEALERAVALEPRDPLLQFSLGMAALRAEQPERSARAFRNALTFDPNFEAARRKLDQLEQGSTPP